MPPGGIFRKINTMRRFYGKTNFTPDELPHHIEEIERHYRRLFLLKYDEPFTVDVLNSETNKFIMTLHFTNGTSQ